MSSLSTFQIAPCAASAAFADAQESEYAKLVTGLIGTPSPRIAILNPTSSGESVPLNTVLEDPRVCDHFEHRIVIVSCDDTTNSEDVFACLAAGLGIETNGDATGAVLDNLVLYRRTLLVLDMLKCMLRTDPQQQGTNDLFLVTFASVEELGLVVTLRGTSLPECVAWTNLSEKMDKIRPKPGHSAVDLACLNPTVIAPDIPSTAREVHPLTELEPVHAAEVFDKYVPAALFTTPVVISSDMDDAHHKHQFGQASRTLMTIAQSKVPPPKPTVFHGRDKEVERLVRKITTPDAAPLGIIGPGGIGKTTLALSVLHDHRVRAHFGVQRFFLTCDGATSPDEVLVQLAIKLGIQPSQNVWLPVIDDLRTRQQTLIILDNFETIWSPTNDSLREASEIFLAQLVTIDGLTVIVTTRGSMLPESFTWSNIDTAELDTLSSTAARQTFEDLSCLEPVVFTAQVEAEALTTLLREVDFMPLAITLLARLDDLPSRLLREWLEHYTEVLEADRHDGTRRELSVEVSIKISLKHLPEETADVQPRQLLSVFGQLPAGMFPRVSADLRDTIAKIDSAQQVLLRHSLIYAGDLGELRMLSPIRHYVSHILPMTSAMRSAVESVYIRICDDCPIATRIGIDGPAYDVELPNIFSILTAAVDHRPIGSVIFRIASHCIHRGRSCLQLLKHLLPRLEDNLLEKAHCLMHIGYEYRATGDKELAIHHFEQAADLFAAIGDIDSQAVVRHSLARLYTQMARYQDGDLQMIRSQQLFRATSDLSCWAAPLPGDDLDSAERGYRTARVSRLREGDYVAVLALSTRILDMVRTRGDRVAIMYELKLFIAIVERWIPGFNILASLKADLAVHYLNCGATDAAESLLIDAHASATGHNEQTILGKVTSSFGCLRYKQRRFAEAIEHFEAAAKMFRTCGWDDHVESCSRWADALRAKFL